MNSVSGPSIRRLVLAGMIGIVSPALAQEADLPSADLPSEELPHFLPMSENWEALAYEFPDGSRRCVGRALYEGFLEGDILWVFNTASRETLPHGYLAIDPRLMDGVEEVELVVAGGGRYAIALAEDGYGYNEAAESGTLLADMRLNYDMTLTMGARSLPVSLRGFTRATREAAAACDFEEPSR